MKGKKVLWLCMLCLPFLTTGCWDQKVTQDIYYVVAVGADYKDNQYTAYLQFSDFSQVAKTEQGKPSETVPIWVATGTGLTLPDAIQNVKSNSAQPIAFSHVSSYILTDRAMEHGMKDILDYIRRYPDFRSTGWMFGTKGDLMQIMSTSPLFNLSPLTMIEHTPNSIAKQYTFIPPMEAREFNKQYRDTARTVILPSLSLTDTWHESGKEHPQPSIDGAFVFQNRQYRSWMSAETLSGSRWVAYRTPRSLVHVKANQGEGSMDLAVWNVKPVIDPHIKNGIPVFDIRVKGRATLLAQTDTTGDPNQMLDKEVRDEVLSTFRAGINQNIDVFNLENSLYRWHHQLWKDTFQRNHLSIQKNMLGDIKVDIKVKHAGRLRFDN